MLRRNLTILVCGVAAVFITVNQSTISAAAGQVQLLSYWFQPVLGLLVHDSVRDLEVRPRWSALKGTGAVLLFDALLYTSFYIGWFIALFTLISGVVALLYITSLGWLLTTAGSAARWVRRHLKILLLWAAVGALLLKVESTSLWYFIYHVVPGAEALRVPNRFHIVLVVPVNRWLLRHNLVDGIYALRRNNLAWEKPLLLED